ncbi:MAG: hypothetical protein NT027_10665 [Proteobacteria bacterium]|nr:hypothetical protein [Pseudomonadota bacterium]
MKRFGIFSEISFKILFSLSTIIISKPLKALPEIARYGHFTCTSCHVSPSGGGVMTTYGKDFSSEKLSTWSYYGEEKLLHGLVPHSDTLLFSGDARWVNYSKTSGDTKVNKFWRMQTDFEAGGHYGPLWAIFSMGTKPAGPNDKPEDHQELKIRGYYLRGDLWDEHITARAGLFIPKYGLMLSDHTAFIRSVTGLGPDSEQTQAEFTYQDDLWEVTAAIIIESEANEREGKTRSGYSLGLSNFLMKKHRLNLNVLSMAAKSGETINENQSFGLSGVATIMRKLFLSAEIDRIHNTTKTSIGTSGVEMLATYSTLNIEIYKGIVPYIRYEYFDSDINSADSSYTRMGAGSNWYPRPHFQFDVRYSRILDANRRSGSNQTDAIIHYYF